MLRNRSLLSFLAVTLVLAGTAVTPAAAQETGSDLGFYFWMVGLDGTIGTADDQDQPVEATISDLAGYLDFSGGTFFETRKPNYILGVDLSFVVLSENRTATVEGNEVTADFDAKQIVGELGGAYRLTPSFDAWVAGRVYTLKQDENYAGQTLESDRHTWADIYVGARYHRLLAEHWQVSLRADVGTGGSDLALFGNAAIGYKFTETFTLAAAYRVLSLDRESGEGDEYFKWDMTQNGAGIALVFALH